MLVYLLWPGGRGCLSSARRSTCALCARWAWRRETRPRIYRMMSWQAGMLCFLRGCRRCNQTLAPPRLPGNQGPR